LLEFQEILEKLFQRKMAMSSVTELLLELSPIISKFWIPTMDFKRKKLSRTKFNRIDDRILLLGLMKYGSRKLEKIQRNYLSFKKINEIKNRFKNLICSRALGNIIKTWKIFGCKELDEAEKKNLEKGIQWFGPKKYALIAKYFLPNRSV
jgi:hypothetical protein